LIRKLLPDKGFFNSGVTTITRAPGETQEQFDATKDQATFRHGGETHTLVLDGKTDDVVLQSVNKYVDQETWITDLKQLEGKTVEILTACKHAEDIFDDLEDDTVTLQAGKTWIALPDFNKEHEVTGYTLLPPSYGKSHSISVDPHGDSYRFSVSTDSSDGALGHSMSGILQKDGSIKPYHEGISWKGEE